jgi:starch phosphorylase
MSNCEKVKNAYTYVITSEKMQEAFNTGDYVNAILNKQRVEAISSILYPDDRSYQVKNIRFVF